MAYVVLIIAVVAITTFLLRALPFIIFGSRKQLPDVVQYMGRVLPPCIMVTLVVYCLKDISFAEGNYGIPEIIAILVVVLIHLWKKNTLLSIAAGTIVYMFLIQVIFL